MANKKGQRAKRRAGYEEDVPACDRCVHFRGQHMELRNSTPQWHPHRCALHGFMVKARGCCDSWQHKATGETLDASKENPQ